MDENSFINVNAQKEAEKHNLQVKSEEQLQIHKTAEQELLAAGKRGGAQDSSEMSRVKEYLTLVNSRMEEPIREDITEFKKQVLDLSEEFGRLIAACENYLSARKMAKYRLLTKGRKRYKKVESLLKVAKKERVQLKDLGKDKELFELRNEDALVGAALVYAVRDYSALDRSLVVAGNDWNMEGELRIKTIGGHRYQMAARSGKKPEKIKNSAAAGRILRFMGAETFGNQPSLVLAQRNNAMYYGVKEEASETRKTMQELSENAGGTHSFSYEPDALKQLSNIKMLRMLFGIEPFDVRNDIEFSYEERKIKGESVFLIKSARIKNFSNAFSKNMTGKTLQREPMMNQHLVVDDDISEFISGMDQADIEYISEDLLSKDQKKAFLGRLEYLKTKIRQKEGNGRELWTDGVHTVDSEEWNDPQIKENACEQVLRERSQIFKPLFDANCHIAGRAGDKIFDYEEEERKRIEREREENRRREEERRREAERQKEEERRREAERQKEEERQREVERQKEEERRKELEKQKEQKKEDDLKKQEEDQKKEEERKKEERRQEENRRLVEEQKKRDEEDKNLSPQEKYRRFMAAYNAEMKRRNDELRKKLAEEEKEASRKRKEQEEREKAERIEREKREAEERKKREEEEKIQKEEERLRRIEERKEARKKARIEKKRLREEKKKELKEALKKRIEDLRLKKKQEKLGKDLFAELIKVDAENEQQAQKKREEDFEYRILNSYSEEEIEAAVKNGTLQCELDKELEKKVDEKASRFSHFYLEQGMYETLNYNQRAEESQKEIDRCQKYFDEKIRPAYIAFENLIRQYEIYLLKERQDSELYKKRLEVMYSSTMTYLRGFIDASGDCRKIRADHLFTDSMGKKMKVAERFKNQVSSLNNYIKYLRVRFTPEAKKMKEKQDSFEGLSFAKEKDRTLETKEASELLIRDLLSLRNSQQDPAAKNQEEDRLLDEYKLLGITAEHLTKEEFANIKRVNEKFAYKLYFEYLSRNRFRLTKDYIPQESTVSLKFTDVTVSVEESWEDMDGNVGWKSTLHIDQDSKDNGVLSGYLKDTQSERDVKLEKDITCIVYSNPYSMKVMNNAGQGGKANYLGIYGTCGPSSASQVINQVCGMNITNESMNVELLDKFSWFGTDYLPECDENGEGMFQDSKRPDLYYTGGTYPENMSDLMNIFRLKHNTVKGNNPPAGSKEKRDPKTGLDTDLFIFAEALKKGGSVQVAIRSEIIWNKGVDPRNDSEFYKKRRNLLSKTYLEKGTFNPNHWINLCGVCFDNEENLLGFLFKDTGAGKSGFISAEHFDKAYRGIADKERPVNMTRYEYTIIEKTDYTQEAVDSRDEQEKEELEKKIEQLEQIITDQEAGLADFAAIDKKWYKSIKGPKDFKTSYYKKRCSIAKAWDTYDKEYKKVYDSIKGAGKEHKLVKALEKRRNATIKKKSAGWHKIRDKYAEWVNPKIAEGRKKLGEVYKDVWKYKDAKKIKAFFTAWEKELKTKDYTYEKHAARIGEYAETGKRVKEAKDDFLAVCKSSEVSVTIIKMLPDFIATNKALDSINNEFLKSYEAFEKKHKAVFKKLKEKPAEKPAEQAKPGEKKPEDAAQPKPEEKKPDEQKKGEEHA